MMQEITVHEKGDLVETLVKNKICKSRSEVHRLLKQGAIKIFCEGRWEKILRVEKCIHQK